MGWFGPNKDEVWRELCEEIGADFVEGGFWKGNRVQAHVAPWTITLDTYVQSTGKTHVTYTRMRAPFVSREGFRFTIYRKSAFSGLGKMLGMQDIEVGEMEFDEDFIIKGNDEMKVCDFFASSAIRKLIADQPKVYLQVQGSGGWFGPKYPEDVDELLFQVVGELKDKEQLKGLFELFAAVLEHLYELGIAEKVEPGVEPA